MLRIFISALAAVLIHGAVLVFFPFFSAPYAPVSQKDTGIAIQITHVLPAPEKKPDPTSEPETPPTPLPEKKQTSEPEKDPLPVPGIEKKPPLPDPPKEPAPTEIAPRKDLLPKKEDLTLAPPKPKVPAPEPDVTVPPDPELDVSPVENTGQTAQKMPDQDLSDFMDAAEPFPDTAAPVSEQSTAPEVRKEAVPLYKENPRPRYPRTAQRRGHTGKVMLMVFVNKTGEAEKLRIFESSGYDSLDHAAEKAVAAWRFEPGTSNGIPTGMWVKIPITFELKQ
ncbi:MAG: energy transducer TonB [Desulfotignum sp.]|nr:energy transducer TonB [Desulfotignum sp.]